MNLTRKISLGFSPCPNDTFIFDALVNNKLEANNMVFDKVVEDVESLNKRALNGEVDMIKVSYGVYPDIADRYCILTAGSALGYNCGPLIVARSFIDTKKLSQSNIAIPGINTTANFLMNLFYPDVFRKTVMIFSEIEEAVTNGVVDAGLIIHESRFTYKEKNLLKIADLGEQWERRFNLPLPLGGIVVKRDLGRENIVFINRLMRESVNYAFNNQESALGFVKKYAADIREEIIFMHIDKYVNAATLILGNKEKAAIKLLLKNKISSKMPLFADEYEL
jgi:1,4-dihydroxy-6-naphthoate synthase